MKTKKEINEIINSTLELAKRQNRELTDYETAMLSTLEWVLSPKYKEK